MKKLILILTAVIFLFSSASLAEDLSALTDGELQALYRDVEAEMARRALTAGEGTEFEATTVRDRVAAFFSFWSVNNLDQMLEMCTSDWKASAADPRTELFKILLNRTPLDLEIESAAPIAGESPDGFTYYLVTATSRIDRNNGTASRKYRFRFLVRKEEDGRWYINPTALNDFEDAEEEFPAEATAAPEGTEGAADTVLYYQPSGGEYYHADQNCPRVNPTFLPLQGCFLYSELNSEPYRNLKRCEICGAPFRQEDPPALLSFRDAVDAAGEYAAVGADIDYLAVAAEKDGCYYRTVTILDDRAKELYMAAMAAEDPGTAFEAFDAYAWSLPVCYTEKITAEPKDQAELDAQAGRTVGELLEEGYSFYGSGGGEDLPTVVDLSSGLFIYEFELDASYGEYLEHESLDTLESLKVKDGVLSASLSIAVSLDWLADGTYQPQVVPNITAEEAAEADSVPPIEEYSRKAWPLTAEGYADLQENMETRYGQVYVVEGPVHQVLSQSPMRVIIFTGEDGKSQPVVVECPEQRSLKWEEGETCKIYADVSSAFYTLPVLTARYMFYAPSEDTAD